VCTRDLAGAACDWYVTMCLRRYLQRVPMRYATSARPILWLGTINCVAWLSLLTPALLVMAQEPGPRQLERIEDRVDTNTSRIINNANTLSGVAVKVDNLERSVDALTATVQKSSEKFEAFIISVVALLVTILGGVLSALWGVRAGWLRIPSEPGHYLRRKDDSTP